MLRLRHLAARFGAALFVLALTAVASAQNAFAIEGARIEIGDGTVIEKGNILIRDGRIIDVGPNVAGGPGYERVDGAGLTVYPGFIDAYTTRGIKLPDPPARGTPPNSTNTAPPTMWEQNRKGIRPDLRIADVLDNEGVLRMSRNQGITSGVVGSGQGTIRGLAALVAFDKPKSVIEGELAQEISFRGGSGEGYPGSLMGIIALLRQTLYDAQRYPRVQNGDEKNKDAALEALAPAVQGRHPVLFAADTEREVFRALQLQSEFNLNLIVGPSREAWRYAEMLRERHVPVIVNLNLGNEPSREAPESADERSDALPQAVRDERWNNWRERALNAVALQAAGVKIAFSSDGTSLDDFLKNVRRVIGLGFPRDAALRALTVDAAQMFRMGHLVGKIAPGVRADLVLMDGDFAQEKTAIKLVFVGGELFDPAAKPEPEKKADDK
jgi:imidazolonepropionase-like amidohydrolase